MIPEDYDIHQFSIQLPKTLLKNILELREQQESLKISNIGGWHSELAADNIKWFLPTLNKITSALENYEVIEYWFNINSPGHFNRWHIHKPKHYAAVLYVSVPEESGDIEFRIKGKLLSIQPSAGQLILFSGNLEHQVLENKSSDNRVSIALNLRKI